MLLTKKTLLIQQSSKKDKRLNNRTRILTPTFADSLVELLAKLGVNHAFGIGGGAIAPLWEALEQSSIKVLHFRHEAGAAFAAMEAYFATNRPVVVFSTTGPGITNALTGIAAAHSEGAKLILISASTPTKLQGKWAFQETSSHSLPQEIFTDGSLFHYARCIESNSELPEITQKLAIGLKKPGGFVAHLSIPADIQTSESYDVAPKIPQLAPIFPDAKIIDEVAEFLTSESFAIWLGFGARDASEEVLQLAKRTGAAVMCSPRGKGIFPENHPQFLGVTGFAGHQSVLEYMHLSPPQRTLVLGTRLGEFTSFWNPTMIPPKGFIHVDIDPRIPGTAYPTADTLPVIADIKVFLRALLKRLPKQASLTPVISLSHNPVHPKQEDNSYKGLIRPAVLMKSIQEVIIEKSNAIIIAEAGNSFAWTTHHLKFNQPKRWRVSTGFGAMGNATTGVLGASMSNANKAVAVIGDGAMLMNNEINTAVQYNIPAVWIVLNDASYNMCVQGMKKLGYDTAKAPIIPTDFVMFARSMGADGVCVESESQLHAALLQAISAEVPFVVDVRVNPSESAPIGSRVNCLLTQSAHPS